MMKKKILAVTIMSMFATVPLQAANEFEKIQNPADAAIVANTPKNAPIKTITSFSSALRCMDELFLAYGKNGIVITSTGIPDETGKVRTGTKEMLITAIAKMTVKSNAFEFIDHHNVGDDLGNLFARKGDAAMKLPDYYIRGSITQMDDNAVRKSTGGGIALSFLDFGRTADVSYDVISMDMSIGDAATRKIQASTSTSNTMVITKAGKSSEGGAKLGKVGLSFNLDLSRSEGLGATTRNLLELSLIETLGKFTQVPYWRCLGEDVTNPLIREQALENFDLLKPEDKILFVQRKLAGNMNRYKGPLDGKMSEEFKEALQLYQSQNNLTPNGVVNFETYSSLLDDTQNYLAALPSTPARGTPTPVAPISTPTPPPATNTGNGGAAQPFRVNLESERGARPAYKVGEVLNLTLSLSNDGTAYCYYEDVGRHVARIFPNQFTGGTLLRSGSPLRLPSGGFKIRFDQPGKERVACLAADREIVVPPTLKGVADLTPLPVRSLDEVISLFRLGNPALSVGSVDITVTK